MLQQHDIGMSGAAGGRNQKSNTCPLVSHVQALEHAATKRTELEREVASYEQRLHDLLGPDASLVRAPGLLPTFDPHASRLGFRLSVGALDAPAC